MNRGYGNGGYYYIGDFGCGREYRYNGNGGYGGFLYGNSSGNSQNMYDQRMLLADKKTQALRYSYETLGNLLSTAENFAGFPNEKYSKFNITSSYDHQTLKSEFAWELYCFQRARNVFQKKFNCPYQFPKDFPQETILKDINRYIKHTNNKQDIILFNCMINIINGNKVNIDFDKLFEELDKNPNNKIDPIKLKVIIGPLNEILDQQLEEADKGNMSLNLFDDRNINHRNNLKHISESNSHIIKILIGLEGKFTQEQNGNFKIQVQSNTRTIKIDNPRFNSFKNLNYDLYTYNNNSGKIIVLQNKCFIFENDVKKFNSDCFKNIQIYELEDKKYIFGSVTIGNNETIYYGLIEEDNSYMK